MKAFKAHNATQPATEAFWMVQFGEVPVSDDERLLRRVFGKMEIAEFGIGVPKCHRLIPLHEIGEGIDVTPFRVLDKLGNLHVRYLLANDSTFHLYGQGAIDMRIAVWTCESIVNPRLKCLQVLRSLWNASCRGPVVHGATGTETPMIQRIRVFMIVETLTFAVAALIHAGTLIDDHEHAEAGIAETVIAMVLLGGIVLSLARPDSTRMAGLGAQGFALLCMLVGLFTIARTAHGARCCLPHSHCGGPGVGPDGRVANTLQ